MSRIVESLYKVNNIFLNESMSPEEKMDAWHNGQRRENIKACGDKKLIDYFDICYSQGYTKEKNIIGDELKKRGYSFEPLSLSWDKKPVKSASSSSSTTTNITDSQPKELTAFKYDDETILVLLNGVGKDLIKRTIGDNYLSQSDTYYKGVSGDFAIVVKSSKNANIFARELMKELKKSNINA